MRTRNTQQGSSLLYVILILAIMLVIAFSISALAVRELKTTAVNEQSQAAFYAAESGIEQALYELIQDPDATGPFDGSLGDGATYRALVNPDGADPVENNRPFQLKSLDVFETDEIYLYDPEDLQYDPFGGVQTANVTVTCVDGCDGAEEPALEIAVYAFDRTDVNEFSLDRLRESTGDRDVTGVDDESNITFSRQYFEFGPLSGREHDFPIGTLQDGGRLDNHRYLLQFKGIAAPASYEVTFDTPVELPGVYVLQSFGDVPSGQRRAIQISLDKNRRPDNILNFVLFEDDSIEKCAPGETASLFDPCDVD